MKLLITLLLLIPTLTFSQKIEGPRYLKTKTYDVVSISPEFKGGPQAMSQFIVDNFVYPEAARKNNEEGTVWIEFVVQSNGKLSDVKVVKGVSKSLNTECIRIIEKMPKWKPGEQAGKKVNVRYTIPIKARLGE
jgi:TonB family protein